LLEWRRRAQAGRNQGRSTSLQVPARAARGRRREALGPGRAVPRNLPRGSTPYLGQTRDSGTVQSTFEGFPSLVDPQTQRGPSRNRPPRHSKLDCQTRCTRYGISKGDVPRARKLGPRDSNREARGPHVRRAKAVSARASTRAIRLQTRTQGPGPAEKESGKKEAPTTHPVACGPLQGSPLLRGLVGMAVFVPSCSLSVRKRFHDGSMIVSNGHEFGGDPHHQNQACEII